MYQKFQPLGEINEVVISNKREKIGMCYGFVCVYDVKYEEFLAMKLDNFFIDGSKLHANIPRFQWNSCKFHQNVPKLFVNSERGRKVKFQDSSRPPPFSLIPDIATPT